MSSIIRLLLLLFISDVYAIFRGSFFNPPPLSEHMVVISDPKQELVFLIGSQINITWQTTYDEYNITLWQQMGQVGAKPASTNVFEKHSGDTELGHYLWTIQTYDFDRNASPAYYLDAKSQTQAAGGQREEFLTFFFNLTDDANDPRLAISQAEVQKAAQMFPQVIPTDSNMQGFQAPSTPSTTGNSKNTSASASASTSASASMPEGTRLALGLGLGLGVPLIIACGALIYCLKTRNKAAKTSPAPSMDDEQRAKLAHWPWQQPTPAYAPPQTTAPPYMAGTPPNMTAPAPHEQQYRGGADFPMHDGAFTAFPVEAMSRESRYEVEGDPEMKPGMVNAGV